MKILIDIGHPGHVHYFRNFIKIMENKGNKFLIISRDKEVAFKLLEFYKIPYKTRGKGGKGFLGKLLYLIVADIRILKYAIKFKPDLFLSFSSTYAGHVAFLIGKPHILFDDTEHAKFEHLMYKPFATAILTPSCFYKNLGKKHISFNGYMELCYLHHNQFIPDPNVLKLLGVSKNEKYIIIRFVSWGASHDFGQYGLDLSSKLRIVSELRKYSKVFISSESVLPEELERYRLSIPPEKLHDALSFASLYLGEGGTTASEASILGIPAIYINSLPLMGYLQDEKDAGLLFHHDNPDDIILKAKEVLSDQNSKIKFDENRQVLLKNKIDVTSLMVWFIENYPASVKTLKENQRLQDRFLAIKEVDSK
jgi:predicted glycosyltransferase